MWTSLGGDRGTTINRVRLRGAAGLDALSAELRAGRAIEQAADGVALPAGAILCVRHLRDPRPGRISLSTWQAPPVEWAQAVGATLADLAARAVRPAAGGVPEDAEAVIFDDRAQLLACLAADWCRGSIGACWWWRALIGTASEAEAVLRAWREQPTHIAAAIEEVARFGLAAAFARRLSERDTAMLVAAVVSVHGLSRRLVGSDPAVSTTAGADDRFVRAVASRAADLQSGGNAAAVWKPSAPEACAEPLRIDQQLLLGVALTLRRHPARARDPIFVSEVAAWREPVNIAGESNARDSRGAKPPITASRDDAAFEATNEVTAASVAPKAVDPSITTAVGDRTDMPMATRGRDIPADAPTRSASVERNDPQPARPAPMVNATIDTGLGGVFYLLNVALALGLYGDFTAPRGPRLDLSIWRLVARVASVLLRGRHRRDPVWPLLADLAGPDEPAIRGTNEWRLDPAWLAAFPEERTWRWDADRDRVRVFHPAGFAILDIERARQRSPAEQVRDELTRYRGRSAFRPARRAGGHRRATETGLARWTRWLALYVRARSGRALGVRASAAGDLLCRHRARVRVTLTHVGVAFSLSDLPIAIRLAGLDRDPGWIPAADRIVSFTYE